MEDDHSEIKIISSPEEHELITTNADELNKKTKKKKKPKAKKNISINVDEDERFFRKKELNKAEITFLLSKGYVNAKFKSISSNKKEDFLLQPRHNESLAHLFAIYDIAEYLEKKGFKVEKYATKKPDIVFKKGNKDYAIEVETGAVLTNKNKMKTKLKVLNGYEKVLFVVTDRNKVSHYKKFGESVDLRYLKPRLRKFIN